MHAACFSAAAVAMIFGSVYGPEAVDLPERLILRAAEGGRDLLDYDPAVVTVWRDAARRESLPVGTPLEELGGSLAGDVDGDGRLTSGDMLIFQAAFGTRKGDRRYSSRCDLTGDGAVDAADGQAMVRSFSSPVRVFEVYVDAPAGGTKAAAAVRARSSGGGQDGPITPMSAFPPVSINPTSGRAGTAVTITMGTSPPTFVFNAQTTATWQGKYVPMVGSPTNTFQVSFNAAQFREFSQGQAIIVIGDGLITGAPNPEVLNGPGSLQGTLTLHLTSGVNVARTFNFGLETNASKWERVLYPDGVGGAIPPKIGGEPPVLQQYLLSLTPNPTNPTQEQLFYASSFHFAAVVRVEENATTSASAPATLAVDLVSYNSAGAEIDRLENIVLQKLLNDGDPTNIVYHNNLTKPIVLVDTVLNKANYPNVFILRCLTNGSASVVPAN